MLLFYMNVGHYYHFLDSEAFNHAMEKLHMYFKCWIRLISSAFFFFQVVVVG